MKNKSVSFAKYHHDIVTVEGAEVTARNVIPAPAAGQRIGRMTEAPCQAAYKQVRQKHLLHLQCELDCKM
jgi:hypothetical protein